MLRAFFAGNACFTRDEPSSKRVGGVGLDPKPTKLRCSWRCTQPRAAKAIENVAVVKKMSLIPRAAGFTVVGYTLLARGTRNAPR